MKKLVFASAVSVIQQSPIFMTAKCRICEAPAANLNGARVAEEFIDEIVNNENRYVTLPLYADFKALTSGKYNHLGHLYDAKTGEFYSTQIGSFYKFEKEVFDGGCALIGYARIPKRNKKLRGAITELFADGNLNFSFEVAVGDYTELDDGTILINASENNYLEGTAIVTFPACENAVALDLVAQKADDTAGGDTEMAENEKVVETEQVEATPELAEEENIEAAQEQPEDENADCKKKEQAENAEVCVHEEHTEQNTVRAFDTETGKEVVQTVVVHTESCDRTDGQLVEIDDGIHVAETAAKNEDSGNLPSIEEVEEEPVMETSDPVIEEEGQLEEEPQQPEQPAEQPEQSSEVVGEKTAEQLIAELAQVVENLKSEIAELKEAQQARVNASVVMTAEVNPFVEDIASNKKYSLLEKAPTNTSYSLLEKY